VFVTIPGMLVNFIYAASTVDTYFTLPKGSL